MNKYKENADILSYNPDLKINTRPNLEEYETSHYDEGKYKSNRSTVLSQFEIHLPSKKIDMLDEVLNDINNYKDCIKTRLTDNSLFNKYFNSDSDNEKYNILKENSNDLYNGSTLLEVYSVYEDIEEEVKNIKDNYIVAIYGKDIDSEEMYEIDEAYLGKLDSYEYNNKHEYINYFNVYYDTQISFLIGEYATGISRNIANLSLIEDDYIVKTYDNSSEDIIARSFEKNNDLLTYDLYKNNINKEDIYTSINNIFLAKQNLNLYYDSFSDYFSLGDEYEIVYEIKDENLKLLEEKLDNLIDSVMMSDLSKDDIYKTLKKKSKIRGFFDVNS